MFANTPGLLPNSSETRHVVQSMKSFVNRLLVPQAQQTAMVYPVLRKLVSIINDLPGLDREIGIPSDERQDEL